MAIYMIIIMLFYFFLPRLDYSQKGFLKKNNKTLNLPQGQKNLDSCTTVTWYVLFKLP